MKMKNLLFLVLALLTAVPAYSIETGPANSVLRVPSGGGRPKYGAVNLSSSVARTGTLPETNGGTNQSTYTTGDTLAASASNTLSKVALGTAGQVYRSVNGAVAWANKDGSMQLENLTLTASVAANALTVAVKTQAAANAGATDPVWVSSRNATLTTGTYSNISITGALSMTVSSGSTLGLTSAFNEYIYVYLINNAGTWELAVAGGANLVDEGGVVSTTAEGGAGAADSRYVLYSTTARSNVPVRLVGRIKSNQTVSGTYGSAVSEIALVPFKSSPRAEVYVDTGNGHGSTATKIRRFTNARINVGTAITYADSAANGGTFTINEEGVYTVHWGDFYTVGTTYFAFSVNVSSTTTNANALTWANGRRMGTNTSSAGTQQMISWTGRLIPGDVVRAHDNGLNDATTFSEFSITRLSD